MLRRSALAMLAASLILVSAFPSAASPTPEATFVSEHQVVDVALDASGNQYIVSFDSDATVKKISSAGLVTWSRTLGGSGFDSATTVAVDPDGNVYAGGHTASADFPVTSGAWRTRMSGTADGWAAKFGPSGTLLYSTFIGGSDDDDTVLEIDWAPSGTVALAGITFSCDFPVTSGAYDKTPGSGCVESDAFVVKLSASGASPIFSTYLGGSGAEVPTGIAVSRGSGTVMVAGATSSADFPTTSGAFQRANRGGEFDGFITKLSSSGASLSFSTLLGGSGTDFIEGIARDSGGDAFVTGTTWSTDLPTTAGAFQTRFGGGLQCSHWANPPFEWIEAACSDAFVARVDDGAAALDYLSYLGSEGFEEGRDIAIDASGAAYLTGATNSTDFPRVDARVEPDASDHPMFAAAISWNGEGLLYSELLPTSRQPSAIVATATGKSYHAGAWDSDAGHGYVTRIGTPTGGIVFSPRGGNEFWIETFIGGKRVGSVLEVEARDNDTGWTRLRKTEWGFFAGGFHVEPGHVVQFRATLDDATVSTSGCYKWPSGESTECFASPRVVSFTHGGGNEWWVEVKIAPKPASARAMDTGGEWKTLAFKSWGEWAASFHIERGHAVRFRAMYADGTSVESCWFTHPEGIAADEDQTHTCTGEAATPPPPPADFDATFKNVRGNEWWIETDVTVTGGTLAGVDARVNGGNWIALEKKSWGSWAKSIHAPSGSTVEFRARASDGQTDASSKYAWPP